jgi:hypothetical protein
MDRYIYCCWRDTWWFLCAFQRFRVNILSSISQAQLSVIWMSTIDSQFTIVWF